MIPIVTDAVYPDDETDLLSTQHRGYFAHDLTWVRLTWGSEPLTDHAVALEERDRKAVSGNC